MPGYDRIAAPMTLSESSSEAAPAGDSHQGPMDGLREKAAALRRVLEEHAMFVEGGGFKVVLDDEEGEALTHQPLQAKEEEEEGLVEDPGFYGEDGGFVVDMEDDPDKKGGTDGKSFNIIAILTRLEVPHISTMLKPVCSSHNCAFS